MGKFLVINGADFSNIAFDKVKIIDSITAELFYNKAFLLKNYGNFVEGAGITIAPTNNGRGLLVIKKTDTNIPLSFNTDYSYIPILGDITKISVKITNSGYNVGLNLVTSSGKVYDSNWQPAGNEVSVNVKDYLSTTQEQLYVCVVFKSITNTKFTNETLDSLGFEITIEYNSKSLIS